MTDHTIDDDILHAYIDGELDTTARRRLLLEMENNKALRKRVGELQRTKEWVKFSFEGERALTRSLPNINESFCSAPYVNIAASMLLMVTAFGAGWFGNTLFEQNPERQALHGSAQDFSHVILHISESDEAKFSVALKKAESILQEYSDLGVWVEVMANAGGLNMLRTSTTSHAERIKRIMEKYNNVRFIACSKGLKRLQDRGLDTELIDGTYSHTTGGDHLIQRLMDGWAYIKI